MRESGIYKFDLCSSQLVGGGGGGGQGEWDREWYTEPDITKWPSFLTAIVIY